MKIFLDSADVETIRNAHATGLVEGVTTNPSKLVQTGKPFTEVIKEICAIVPGPVSVEAVADTADDLTKEAEKNAQLAPNVVVKLPMTAEGLKAVPVLEIQKDIRVNVTMVFSSTQAYLAMKAGASYVSIVLSRLDAFGSESDVLVQDAVTIRQNCGFTAEIIGASLKTQYHVLSCLRAGIDIATVPESLFFQLFKHPLTDAGLAQFAEDWKKVPK
jgi:transaldolase